MGERGCETQLRKLWETDPLIYSTYVKREQAYPYEIDHLIAWWGIDNRAQNPDGSYKAGPYDILPYDRNMITKMLANNSTLGWHDPYPELATPNEGFLYGAVYGNPNNAFNFSGCRLGDSLFLGYVHIPQIGGFGYSNDIGWGDNGCGVITRGLEKVLGIY
jgi:hypothetical protein